MGDQHTQTPQPDTREPSGDVKSPPRTRRLSSLYYPPHGTSVTGADGADAPPLTRGGILFLQRAIGNHAVERLFRRKARVSRPGDPDEREADRVAEQVMRMPAPSLSRKDVSAATEDAIKVARVGASQEGDVGRRASAEDERRKRAEEETTIQAKEEPGPSSGVSPETESQINSLRGGGEPLPESVRADFEPRFGADFSGVRVHQGPRAAEAARAVNARAYTAGSNVVFGASEYAPETDRGKRLLAHELTHVVQQGGASQARPNGGERAQPQIQTKAANAPVTALNLSAAPVIQRESAGDNKLARLDEMLDQTNVPEEDVITLCGELSTGEKATVVAGGYRSRMASALNVGEMVRAVNNLGPVLSTKLEWVKEASLFTGSIDYSDIQGMVQTAPEGEKEALKINFWKDFFVDVCTNETMVAALNDLKFDLPTKLRWLQSEMMATSTLDYATIQPWITDATDDDRKKLNSDEWKQFFVDVCDNETMIVAVNDLGFDTATKVNWILAETDSTSSKITYPFEDADESGRESVRGNGSFLDALKKLLNEQEFARAAAAIILIVPPDVVDQAAAKAEALRILTTMLINKDVARGALDDLIAVIIPRNKLLTEVAQFSDLAGEETFDGRPWETVRGVHSDGRVALAEENLLGGQCTATYQGKPVPGKYEQGYSTSTHEVAHGLHQEVLGIADKAKIERAFSIRKVLAKAAPDDPNQWVDGREGCYASQTVAEFFAQLSNAYLGTNTGTDPKTGDKRHNGKAWVQANEPKVYSILERMYGGTATVPGANP